MPRIVNEIGNVANLEITRANNLARGAATRLGSGKNGPSDIIGYVVGTQLKKSAEIISGVNRGVNYGKNLLGVATANLEDINNKLTDIRKLIAQSHTATGATLTNLDALYKAQVADIVRILSTAEFNERTLFNGSMADSTGVAVAAAMPAGGGALQIRVGENITNRVNLTIAKLLSGNGSAVDAPIAEKFTPLFPIDQVTFNNAANARAGLALVSAAMLNAGVSYATADNAGGGALAGINAIVAPVGNAIGAAIVNAAKAAAATQSPISVGAHNTQIGANEVVQAAYKAAIAEASKYLNADVIAVLNQINNIAAGAVGEDETAARALVNALIAPGNNRGNAALAAAQAALGANGANANAGIARRVQALDGAAALAGADGSQAAYDLTNLAQQTLADGVIKSASETVASIMSDIAGQSAVLESSYNYLSALEATQNDGASDYLDTNFTDDAERFKNAVLRVKATAAVLQQSSAIPQIIISLIQA